MEFKRYENESDDELLYRICSQKDTIGTWADIAEIINSITGNNFGESAYRKKYQAFNKLLDANKDRFNSASDELNQIKEERRELEKARVKFRDERNEYNKLIRQEARKESYIELVKRVLKEYSPASLNFKEKKNKSSDNDLIIHLTDIHTGININNWFNQYDENILKDRLCNYLNEIVTIRHRHDSENAYLIIGEVLSGLIHENLRCENNQNLIEQFLTISKYLSEFINELSMYFSEVHVYVTPGNHSRISPKKEQNLKGENFDNLLIPYLSAMLQNNKRIFLLNKPRTLMTLVMK